MSSARFIVGDVLEVLRSMPDDSVDLVLTSPPFLALRSYLPADHPDKGKELGSEPTPGAFIDALLDVVEECRRVLAPHGSLCIELGDTYAGSGGAGGDYGENGLREGQPKFKADRPFPYQPLGFPPPQIRQERTGSRDYRPGRENTTTAWTPRPNRTGGGRGWPQDKSLALVPELFRISLAYGVNPLTGRTTEPWRIRNVVRWVRPNPPVGALGDKFRPATSEMVVATMSRTRYFDLDAVRTEHRYAPLPQGRSHGADNGSERRMNHGKEAFATDGNPAGAPPLDWWAIPTEPYPGSHYATWPRDFLVKPIKSMCPTVVCSRCGPLNSEGLSGLREGDNEPAGDELLQQGMWTDEGPHEPQAGAGVLGQPGLHHDERLPGTPDGNGSRLHPPASAGDGRASRADAPANGDRAPQERREARQPDREPRGDGPSGPLRHGGDRAQAEGAALSSLRGSVEFLRDCPRCGGPARTGVVLDCFGGSGTAAQVATGHGRDCVLVDLDERNADLAMQRVGMFLTVEHHTQSSTA